MLKNALKAVGIILLALLLQKTAFAADGVVELPKEELARESVLPVFDKPVSVKNRSVTTAGRFDADIFYGTALTEPISDVSKFGLGVYYNINEDHAVGILLAKNSTGLSSYANQLNSQYQLDFNRAPKPDLTTMIDYNIKAFYGKMSLTKHIVFNTILYGSASLGAIKYENKTYPAAAIGIGQKFFFTPQWALRFDLRLYANNAPSPFLAGYMQSGQPTPTFSQFQDKMTYTTNMDLGLSYLF